MQTESKSTYIICAISQNPQESRFIFDGVRWAQFFFAKGIPIEQINLFAPDDLDEALGNLTGEFKKKPTLTKEFISPQDLKELWNLCRRGDPSMFIDHLNEISNNDFDSITLVLLNHGSSQGSFGVDPHAKFPNSMLVATLEKLKMPITLLVSACFPEAIFNGLHDRTNMVFIFDQGIQSKTYNWSYDGGAPKHRQALGTLLSYWLFDKLRSLSSRAEISQVLKKLNKLTLGPYKDSKTCHPCIKGNVAILESHDFFGFKPTVLPLQPSDEEINYVEENPEAVPTLHELFLDTLSALVEKFLEKVGVDPSTFWREVYMYETFSTLLSMPRVAVQNSYDVAKVLEEKSLTTLKFNGAYIAAWMVTHDFTLPFLEFVYKLTRPIEPQAVGSPSPVASVYRL